MSSVERPTRRRRRTEQWWRRWADRVWRGEAVETVKETVVGEGRNTNRWGSIGWDWGVVEVFG